MFRDDFYLTPMSVFKLLSWMDIKIEKSLFRFKYNQFSLGPFYKLELSPLYFSIKFNIKDGHDKNFW